MFLGYKISENGISIDDSRIKTLKNYPVPKSAKHVKKFLGLAGYYRQFIKNYSDIVKPLNNFTRKDIRFKWDNDCETAFRTLLKHLTEAPILAYPDFTKPFHLATDASKYGVGAVIQPN